MDSPLGHGTDGSVWKSSEKTAVKALELQRSYSIEVECYKRFKKRNLRVLDGFAVPEMLGFNDDLLVIEMRIVTPPFILDFAKAWLDGPMEFEEGGHEEWLQDCEDRFESNWPKVSLLLAALRQFGIYYYDAKPANITF